MNDEIVPLTADELQKMLDNSPFIAFLGLKVTEADPANEQITMTCAMRPEFERGKGSGQWHGGPLAAIIDTVGDYALITQEPAYITSRQIEAARRAMTRYVRRGGKIWIRIFPDKPATKKPAETRMGSGKGAPDHWVAVVKPGRILFEMAGVDHESAVEAMRLASHKLPVATRVVVREGAKEAN